MDLFDPSFTAEAVQQLKELWANTAENESKHDENHRSSSYWIKCLSFIVLSGQLAANYLSHREAQKMVEIDDALDVFRCLRENQPGTFDVDVSNFLEEKANQLSANLKTVQVVESCQEAVQLLHKLAQMDPTTNKDLAQSLNNLGVELRNMGRHEDAVHANEEMVSLHRKLAETGPTINKKLAWSLINLGPPCVGKHIPSQNI